MIRTVVKPDNQNISNKLPKHFAGKKVEEVKNAIVPGIPVTHLAGGKVLAKDWLTSEEYLAWQDL